MVILQTWWTSSTGYVADLELSPTPTPSGGGGRLWLERRVPVAYCAGSLPPAVRTDHPGDVHFSQDLYHPSPILDLNALQWYEQTELVEMQETKPVSLITF